MAVDMRAFRRRDADAVLRAIVGRRIARRRFGAISLVGEIGFSLVSRRQTAAKAAKDVDNAAPR